MPYITTQSRLQGKVCVTGSREGDFIVKKGLIHQKHKAILKVYSLWQSFKIHGVKIIELRKKLKSPRY